MMRILNRYRLDSLDIIDSDFSNIFGGVYSQVRIKLGENQTLSPNITIGYTGFKNKIISDTLKGMLSISTGLNYTSRNFGASARYIRGPNFFIAEDFFNDDIVSFETVYLRAHVNKFLHNRKIKISAYGTYYLRMPSNRQNFVASGRFDFILPQRWKAYLTANLFTNSSDDEQIGVVTHRNFSLNVGVNKSFDIPQPRIKYYDLKVICFNDFDGNGEREENEPLLSNIIIRTNLNPNIDTGKEIRFGDTELITDTEGEMTIIDIPEGSYIMKFEPMENLGNLYNSKGDEQEILVSEDLTLYIPYVESYKVKGRIVLNRDEYSSKGLINVNGIRVSATTVDGQIFSALTDNDGSYVINVPQAGAYTVKVNNIFGEGFEIDKDKFLVQFNGFKVFNVDFTFFEGKRKINFGGNNFFNFGAGGSDDSSSDTNLDDVAPINVDDNLMQNKDDLNYIIDGVSESNVRSISEDIDPNKVKFMVEIGVYAGDVPVDVANKMIELGVVPTPIESAGITIYATQVVGSHDEAAELHKNIVRVGFTQAIIVGSYNGKVISEQKAIEYKK